MPSKATKDGWVMVESSDKMWSTGEGNGKPHQNSCLENSMNSMKRQKDKALKDELCRLVGAQYTTGEEWRNNSIKNEETEPEQTQHSAVEVTGDERKVQCCKDKLEVFKQEMVRKNNNILGINELKWTEMSKFNSDDHYIYYCG